MVSCRLKGWSDESVRDGWDANSGSEDVEDDDYLIAITDYWIDKRMRAKKFTHVTGRGDGPIGRNVHTWEEGATEI